MTEAAPVAGPPSRLIVAVVWSVTWFLMAVVGVFVVVRLATDVPNVVGGRVVADTEFDARYAAHPIVAYAHIVPGMVFLLGAVHQLSARLRRRHLERHGRVGRILVASGVVSALFAIWFGVAHPYGGVAESSAAVVFGIYLLVAVLLAFRSARRRDISAHRAWMIRAFSVAVGVGSIRLVVGLSEAAGLMAFDDVFGLAFWIALPAHALAAVAWLARYPGTGWVQSWVTT